MDINSENWCDIVFEGRNKKYGAYRMRRSSSRRHLLAFLITTAFAALLTAIPTLIEVIRIPDYGKIKMDESLHVSLLQMENSRSIQEYLRQYEIPPPQASTAPVMGDASDYDLLFEDIVSGEEDSEVKKKVLI
ncbi:MAG: hypothetical protein LBS07_02090 [Prevotellaceae bacterium]|jgi:protein TonB|nr:hypothetical protein [Prevotellaceae bacterium]